MDINLKPIFSVGNSKLYMDWSWKLKYGTVVYITLKRIERISTP